jgi:phosphatidate cytidylyltransferase
VREHVGRVLSALVALPLLFGAVRFLPLSLFAVLIAAVVFLAQIEFYRMTLGARPRFSVTLDRHDGPAARRARYAVAGVGAAAGAGIVVIASQPAWASGLPLLATALVMAVGVAALGGGQDWRQASTDAALVVFGVWYVAWLFAHLVSLRELRGGEWLVFFVLWVTWIGDAAAYYVGRAIGKTPLAPRLSPKKTVAGAVGGVAASAAAAVIAAAWFVDGFSWPEAVGVGVGGGLAGMAGDLAESMFKRGAGVKDSGGLIPSHGGFLDKIDGLLFTAPLFYYYLVWVKGYGAHGVAG